MAITQIHIADIKSISDQVEQNGRDCNDFLNIVKGEVEFQKVNENYNKIIIRNASSSIRTIIIDCKENKIEAVSFNGTIQISPKDLFEMYKHYRQGHSVRDDLYFYFFNEDKKLGDCRVSFFEPSNNQINVMEDVKSLSNLTLNW